MQPPTQVKRPLGIVYVTSMSRPDAALALAMINGLEGKKDVKIASVAVVGSGLGAAAFCDALDRLFTGSGAFLNSNNVLPIGLAADGPLPPDPPMVKPALERKNDKGEPAYACTIHKVSDTAEVSALVRNSLTNTTEANAVMVLSAPATSLARTLDLTLTPELFAAKLKMLVIVDTGAAQDKAAEDPAALRKVLAQWPTPIVLCGREMGEAFPYPASSIEHDFSWALAHPVVDAYRAYRPMPYDAPTWDMAAVLHAVHPDQGFFKVSDPGTIQVSDNGSLKFVPSADGKHRSLIADPAQKERVIKEYVALASSKPVPRQPNFRPGQKKADDAKKPQVETKPDGAKPDGTKPDAKPTDGAKPSVTKPPDN